MVPVAAKQVRTPRPETLATSYASTLGVRSRMQLQRTRDTEPEMAVRRLLHHAGFRYRVDVRPLPKLNRRADIVFTGVRVAVFVDGCFWHGCPEHGSRTPTTASGYWADKIARNKTKDADTDRQLLEAGWLSIRAWAHDDPSLVAARVAQAVLDRRSHDV